MKDEKVFYSAARNTIIDFVLPSGFGKYSNESLEGTRDIYPDAVVIPYANAQDLYEKAFQTSPVRITKERWMDMLDILPPSRWTNHGHTESFHVCEHIAGNIVSWFVRIGSGDYAKYFELADTCKLSHIEVTTRCRGLL